MTANEKKQLMAAACRVRMNVIKGIPTHELTYVAAVAPTCYAEGNVEHWYCSDCGYAWLNAEMTQVTNLKNVVVPALGHVDANLDITCDFEGCTKRILPPADSKVSLFTANHMIIVSLSSSYY